MESEKQLLQNQQSSQGSPLWLELREDLCLNLLLSELMRLSGLLSVHSWWVSITASLSYHPTKALTQEKRDEGSAESCSLDNACYQQEGGLLHTCKPFFFLSAYSFFQKYLYSRSPLANSYQCSK